VEFQLGRPFSARGPHGTDLRLTVSQGSTSDRYDVEALATTSLPQRFAATSSLPQRFAAAGSLDTPVATSGSLTLDTPVATAASLCQKVATALVVLDRATKIATVYIWLSDTALPPLCVLTFRRREDRKRKRRRKDKRDRKRKE
jgi:hypothetical protein